LKKKLDLLGRLIGIVYCKMPWINHTDALANNGLIVVALKI
jgi:hypothetical protein